MSKNKLCEELGEFVAAYYRWVNNPTQTNRVQVVEELVDVCIVAKQLAKCNYHSILYEANAELLGEHNFNIRISNIMQYVHVDLLFVYNLKDIISILINSGILKDPKEFYKIARAKITKR